MGTRTSRKPQSPKVQTTRNLSKFGALKYFGNGLPFTGDNLGLPETPRYIVPIITQTGRVPMSTGDAFHEQRDHLVALLYEAAELEHSACCMYLSAAFSMRTDPLEGGCTYEQIDQIRIWKSTMLSIARMEMEHLAIVNNVLTAIGEPNWFQRPAFPMSKRFFPVDLPLALLPFTLETLGTFLLLEFPDEPTPQERDLVAYLKTSPLPADQHLLERIGNARSRESHSLVELYDAIIDLVTRLGAEKPERLFIGLAAAQVAGTTLFPEFPPSARACASTTSSSPR